MNSLGIIGNKIFNEFPFTELPETRKEVDWGNRGVEGWGNINVPSISDGDASMTIFSKKDLKDYIENFKNKFLEEPIFLLDNDADWFDKVKITNNDFNEWKNNYINAKGETLKRWGTTNENLEIRKVVREVMSEVFENYDMSFLEKLKLKLKGVSEDQLQYNIENGLPWDWKGSKEGFYEKMEPRQNYSGSN